MKYSDFFFLNHLGNVHDLQTSQNQGVSGIWLLGPGLGFIWVLLLYFFQNA